MAGQPEVLTFADARELDDWLAAHPDRTEGIWLRIARTGSGARTVTYAEAVEVALCHGWIDGKRTSGAEQDYYRQLLTPRRRRSRWSRINRDKATALIAAGRMHAAGVREVERAKSDGRWDAAYAGPASAEVPPDLAAALDAEPAARAAFDGLDGRNRYAVLYRIDDAKRPETRARRIEQVVAMLARGETFYPQRR